VIYVPGNDFDTMSSYVCRIKLEELGRLEDTATNELQYIFPKFFDYLHTPFLKLGYCLTLPSFALFGALLFILYRFFEPRLRIAWLILVFACQPILATCASMKNDLALGVFAFLAWFVIARLKSRTWYLPVCCILLATLIGTKWHGFALAGVLGAIMLYRACRERLFTSAAPIALGLALPIVWIVGSGDVYFRNWQRDGRIMPKPEWLSPWKVKPRQNLRNFVRVSALETLDLPAYFVDRAYDGKLYKWVRDVTRGTKERFFILMPSSDFTAFGGIILVVLLADIYVLCRFRRFSFATRASAFAALVYFAALIWLLRYNNWINRYFLPAYILSIVPAAEALAGAFRIRLVRAVGLGCAVVVSMQSLLFHLERNLIDVRTPDWPNQTSILRDLGDRDRMYYHVWRGYWDIHQFMRDNVRATDSLLFLNKCEPHGAPFLYPLIKDRSPANTYAFNTRQGRRSYEHLLGRYDFVMVFRGTLDDPRYEPALLFPGVEEMNIYRRRR